MHIALEDLTDLYGLITDPVGMWDRASWLGKAFYAFVAAVVVYSAFEAFWPASKSRPDV